MIRYHIGIFGAVNSGKSTLFNKLCGQELSIVSPVPGTTTDPVRKNIEIEGAGPCTLIDTAGLGDASRLGSERIGKTYKIAEQVDLALVIEDDSSSNDDLLKYLEKYSIPVEIISGKESKEQIFGKIVSHYNISEKELPILGGLVKSGDKVILVCPQDREAPQGRLILPQQQAIKDILDNNAIALVLQPAQLEQLVNENPALFDKSLTVTDSSCFAKVAATLPKDAGLTSFSILLSRSKGPFEEYLKGISALDSLQDGDKVLILESCTHTVSCVDIGRVRLPALIRKHSGKNLIFDFISGQDDIDNPSQYALAVQCGGCMVTRRQLNNRLASLIDASVPITNYGMAIAHITGILERSISILR